MPRTLTNYFSLNYSIESALGTAGTTWYQAEPNTINTFGANTTTTPRNPISKNRQRQKGSLTDLDSAVEFEADLTRDHFMRFVEGFTFASFTNPGLGKLSSYIPSAVVSAGYTVAASGDLPSGTLVYARGFGTSGNNGLKEVTTSTGATTIDIDGGLTAEASPPSNVSVEVCGFRAAAGDLEIDANGDLISTTLDFTTIGLTAGQAIWIGGEAAANQFFEQANSSTNYGFARAMTIAANKITLDKKRATFATDDGTDTGSAGTARQIDIYWGRFCRNVSVDDSDFLERSYHFEGGYTDLDSGPADVYEYAKGNYCNQLQLNFPLTELATATFGFIGTDTEVPVAAGSRKSGASSAISPSQTDAYNTSSDFARLRVQDTDETGLSTDFKDMTVTFNNNVTPEKVLDTLGAKYMNVGNFEVDIEATLLFTNKDVISRVRNNTTVTMDFAVKNDDGGIFIDIPSMTLGDGSRDFPENESINVRLNCMTFQDDTLGTSIGTTMFPFLPTV